MDLSNSVGIEMDLSKPHLLSLAKAMNEDDFTVTENVFNSHPDKVCAVDLNKLIATIERFASYLDVVQDIVSIDPRVSLLDLALLLHSDGFKQLYWALLTDKYSRVPASPQRRDLPNNSGMVNHWHLVTRSIQKIDLAEDNISSFLHRQTEVMRLALQQCSPLNTAQRQRITDKTVAVAFALFPFLSCVKTEENITEMLENEMQNDYDKTFFNALKFSRLALLTAEAGDFEKSGEFVLRARIELDQVSLNSRSVSAHFDIARSEIIIFNYTGYEEYLLQAITDIVKGRQGLVYAEDDIQELWNRRYINLLTGLA